MESIESVIKVVASHSSDYHLFLTLCSVCKSWKKIALSHFHSFDLSKLRISDEYFGMNCFVKLFLFLSLI